MSKTAFVRARIEPELKEDVEKVFEKLGVTTTQVITMLYKQIKRSHRIPLDMSVPNAQTARAIKAARKRKGVVECKDEKELFKNLGL